ncbi:MAG: DUF3817 domain-containing protein [Saprospiraceae bacterium]|jgi:integral membrane protein|nr:DUF3817 domain-containing protein [Saprospiraceae bacterium]
MQQLIKTNLGRLRILAFLEGMSLLVLVFITVPMKYIWGIPEGSQIIGPIHGVLFVLFVINAVSVGIEYKWTWFPRIALIILSSFIPFGSFYIDKKFLKPAQVV